MKVENEGNTVFVSVCLFVIILVGVVLLVCSFFLFLFSIEIFTLSVIVEGVKAIHYLCLFLCLFVAISFFPRA